MHNNGLNDKCGYQGTDNNEGNQCSREALEFIVTGCNLNWY